MRIGLVRRGYSASGGAEAYLSRFADAARAAGHEPVLICGSEWPREAWPHEMAVVVGKTPQGFADRLEERRESGGWDVLFSLERVWACDVYRAGDGVHAAWLERRAEFEPAWRGWFRKLQRKHREIMELECALFTGGARRVIANSQMVKDEIISHYGTPAEHVTVIHNGVPIHAAEPGMREKIRAELGIAPAEYVALFAGTGWERKGLRYAVAAVNALKIPVTLLVAGRGESRGLRASNRVRFLGSLPGERLRAMLAAADVFILPTLYDPFSNACIEALADGVPVITTTANGFAEIIERGVEGDAVPPGDTRALVNALTAWADPARREAVRPRLLEKAAHCSVEENLARTLEVITAARSA
ncbi:MAG: glycosyltransferase family 4 protein [Chthoniobacteraceae bacterium]